MKIENKFEIGEIILFKGEEAIIIGFNKSNSQCLLDLKWHSKKGFLAKGSWSERSGKTIDKLGNVIDISGYEQIWWAYFSEVLKITKEKWVIEKQCQMEKLILKKLIKMQKNYE